MISLETAKQNNNIKEIKSLYLLSFPKVERKPFWLMMKKSKVGEMEILAIKDGEDFLGLMITIPRENAVLLDYFAVIPEKRGGGIGAEALKLLENYYPGKTIVIEIETPNESAPNNNERIRRNAFYQRYGFVEMGIDISLFGVDMKLLTIGGEIDYGEYILFYSEIFGKNIRKNIKLLKIG